MNTRLSYANVMSTVAVFVALGGGSYAAVRSSSAGVTLPACASARTGALRILLKRGARCHHGERALRLDQAGSPGPTGPRGSTGPAGPAGATGATGATGSAGSSTLTGMAGGDLTGSYPNPTVATIGGHTPVTDATAAGGALTGTYPDPTLGDGVVSAANFAQTSAFCGVEDYDAGSGFGSHCTGSTNDVTITNPSAGVYCVVLPYLAAGGAVSADAEDAGFPFVFMSNSEPSVEADCGTSPALTTTVLVTTYSSASSSALADEDWYGFFF